MNEYNPVKDNVRANDCSLQQSPQYKRRSIRLKGYDYSQAGLYFVTLCAKNRISLFGKIENEIMILNDAGKHTEYCWHQIPHHFPNAILHEYITMPNHIHGIIQIGANDYSPQQIPNPRLNDYSPQQIPNPRSNDYYSPQQIPNPRSNDYYSPQQIPNPRSNDYSPHSPQMPRSPSKTIGSIIRGYKIGVTKWFRKHMSNEYPVGQSVWQRNYYEHIIRNEQSYHKITEYIINNPKNWNDNSLNIKSERIKS